MTRVSTEMAAYGIARSFTLLMRIFVEVVVMTIDDIELMHR